MTVSIAATTARVPILLTDEEGVVLKVRQDGSFEWGADGENRLHKMAQEDRVAHAIRLLYQNAPIDYLRNLLADEGTGVQYLTSHTPRGIAYFFAVRDDAVEMLEDLLARNEAAPADLQPPMLTPEAADECRAMLIYLRLTRNNDAKQREAQERAGAVAVVKVQKGDGAVDPPDAGAAAPAPAEG